jgi:hypothetical protein
MVFANPMPSIVNRPMASPADEPTVPSHPRLDVTLALALVGNISALCVAADGM